MLEGGGGGGGAKAQSPFNLYLTKVPPPLPPILCVQPWWRVSSSCSECICSSVVQGKGTELGVWPSAECVQTGKYVGLLCVSQLA